jgi:hypothetical protein
MKIMGFVKLLFKANRILNDFELLLFFNESLHKRMIEFNKSKWLIRF